MYQSNKYHGYPSVHIPDRTWPDKHIEEAPRWCSVDLRDGNQALIKPMSIEEKLEFFKLLLSIGFKELEIGFPSASRIEFDFIRTLVDTKMIPDDVSIQVLVQAREELIKKTCESLQGIHKPIIHLYNSTSKDQREIVFKKSCSEVIDLAVQGVEWIKQYAAEYGIDPILQYSPESFTGTELEFALQICDAVSDAWGTGPDRPMIINLPSTVELSTPNIFADRIEWMSKRLKNRAHITLSVHTHNDRGTAVASAELALLAGAERVEGTLFGNGERTGNVDLLTVALNMFTQGIDPQLNFRAIDTIKDTVERINKMPVHARHPYAGELIFTAFSGSHQDAIHKGLKHQKNKKDPLWTVPYLPIDPADIGRTYEDIIRVNSQSGKGGIAYIIKQELGFDLPRGLQVEFARTVQNIADTAGTEITAEELTRIFKGEYLENKTLSISNVKFKKETIDNVELELAMLVNGEQKILTGIGNGPLDACKNALANIVKFNILSYSEKALASASSAEAVAYVEIESKGKHRFGIGTGTNITMAAIKAVVSAVGGML